MLNLFCFSIRFFFSVSFSTASPSTISSGLKAQTWSPWSPHHQLLYNQTKYRTTTTAASVAAATNTSLSNLSSNSSSSNSSGMTIQPIRRASMTTPHAKNTDENCTFRSGKKPFKRTNTFDSGLFGSLIATAKISIGQTSNANINSINRSSSNNINNNVNNSNNSCDMDNTSSSSAERSYSLENVSTRSNPF